MGTPDFNSYMEYQDNNEGIVRLLLEVLLSDPDKADYLLDKVFDQLYYEWGTIQNIDLRIYQIINQQADLFDSMLDAQEEYELGIRDELVIGDDNENYIRYLPLETAISKLAPIQQRNIRMHYFDMKTEQEIADEMGVSQQAVNNNIQKAKAKLRELLADEKDL